MKNKKLKPLVILSIMVLILVSIGVIFYARESSKSLTNTNIEKVFEKADNESEKVEEINDSEKEEIDNSEIEIKAEDKKEESNEKKETTTIKNNTSSNNTVSNNNSNGSTNNNGGSNTTSSNNTKPTQSTTSQETKNEEQKPMQPSVPSSNNSNNDSKEVDTNSFYYSIHRGTINTKTQSGCLGAGEEIAFIDTVDINYFRCYEVTAKDGSILGYYLNIFCNSDNCNRYKSQIDWSKYN